MNDPKINVQLGAHIVGAVRFPRGGPFVAWRTADGLAWTIPTEFAVAREDARNGVPLISNVRARVSFGDVELGVARDDNFYFGVGDKPGAVVLRMPAAVVHHFERLRAGGPIACKLEFRAEVCAAMKTEHTFLRSHPQQISQDVVVTYDQGAWTAMLNATGLGDNVVVEISLPPQVSGPWADIWKALRTARDALKQPGEASWKAAITESRVALEHWQKLEQEDHGPGWSAPSPQDRRARTRAQRLDNLRWDLLQCAHDAAHTHADRWTREDAVLAVATLAALLSVRNP
ncbi:MAG TPA: hypothetical protein VGI39_27290 [Polyangiaceae bacterium]|jgi:hypothetical protein